MMISYVNGRYFPHHKAKVSIDDRGLQFSDGVYEVMLLLKGKILDEKLHFDRLARSLEGLEMVAPCPAEAMRGIIMELARRNRRQSGMIYLQISRGTALRNHIFPVKPVKPSLIITLSRLKTPTPKEYEQGVKAITLPDQRWARRDIKSISLLPNILARQKAYAAGAREAWLIENGYVTEGSTSNTFIVTKHNTLKTHPASQAILGGCTRKVVLGLAKKMGINIDESPFTLAESLNAKGAFITSTSAGVLPVIEIDGKKIGEGRPDEITKQLIELHKQHVSDQA